MEEEQRTLRIDRGEERLSHQHFVQAGLGSRFLAYVSCQCAVREACILRILAYVTPDTTFNK